MSLHDVKVVLSTRHRVSFLKCLWKVAHTASASEAKVSVKLNLLEVGMTLGIASGSVVVAAVDEVPDIIATRDVRAGNRP